MFFRKEGLKEVFESKSKEFYTNNSIDLSKKLLQENSLKIQFYLTDKLLNLKYFDTNATKQLYQLMRKVAESILFEKNITKLVQFWQERY